MRIFNAPAIPATEHRPTAVPGRVRPLLALGAGSLAALLALPAAAAETRTLEERLEALERQIAQEKEKPVIQAGERGFSLQTSDGNYQLRLRGHLELDGRFFVDDETGTGDTFLVRRARPTLDGRLGERVGFRITPELAGDSSSLLDAWIDFDAGAGVQLRAGQFKAPVGLERLQSASALRFAERAFPTELAPNRDIGLQLAGKAWGGKFQYAVAVTNGTVDGRNTSNRNSDDELELNGRLFVTPGAGLGIGIAGSTGKKEGTGNNFLPRYRNPSQEGNLFQYATAAAADGRHERLSPQAYWYHGPFGVQAEYIVSRQRVALGPEREDLSHNAAQVTASWVLTGEDSTYEGVAAPRSPVDAGGLGAWEIALRYSQLDIDDDAFPIFADPSRSAEQAEFYAIGVNVYLTRQLKAVLNYLHTSYDGGAAGGSDRDDEQAVIARLQLAF